MKINPKRVRNIVKLEDNFATLEGIGANFIYDLSLYCDVSRIPRIVVHAATPGKMNEVVVGYNLVITAYTQPPISKTPTFQKAMSSRDVIDGLKSHYSRKRAHIIDARSGVIKRITVPLPQRRQFQINVGGAFSGEGPARSRGGSGPIWIDRPTTSLRLSYDIEDEDVNKIPELSVALPTNATTGKQISPKRSAIKTILRDGIDPSSIADGQFPVQSHIESIQGLSKSARTHRPNPGTTGKVPTDDGKLGGGSLLKKSVQQSVKPKVSKMSMSARDTVESASLLAHLGTQNITSVRQAIINQSVIIIDTNFVSMWKPVVIPSIELPNEKLKGLQSFYLLFEVKDRIGTILDTFSRKVNHEDQLIEYLTPDDAPSINVKRTIPGQNILAVSQNDDVATAVEVSRRFIDPRSPTMESKFVILGVATVMKGQSSVRFDDTVNNTRACLYRTVAIGPRGHRSSKFGSVVSRPFLIKVPIPEKKRSVTDPTHVSVFAESVGKTIRVRLTNIPEGPVSAYVIAHDLTINRSGSSKRIVGSENYPELQVKDIMAKTADLIFEDTDVKNRHIYEYRCMLIYPEGHQVLSKSFEIIEFRQDDEVPRVMLSLGKPELRMDDSGSASISFDIGSRYTDSGIEETLEAMESAGITGTFLQEIKNNRGKFNSLLSFLVVRQESVTGETETFGQVKRGRFVDDMSTRSAAGVSELTQGRSYRYVIQLMMRDAETLFDDVSSEAIQLDTQKKFRKKMAKFFNPKTLETSTLPSTAESAGVSLGRKKSAATSFQVGRTAVYQSLDVSIPRRRIEVTNLSVTRVSRRRSLVQWDVLGDESRIDHFIVIGEYRGIKAPLGKVHHESDSGMYRYYDSRLSTLVGSVSYSVVAVLTNFIYTSETEAVVTKLISNEPRFVRGV